MDGDSRMRVLTLEVMFFPIGNLLARKPFDSPGGLFDRAGEQWSVIDEDGTRQAARQRALPLEGK